MDFVQISMINYDDLASSEEREWVEAQDPYLFVEVAEGDASQVRSINSFRKLFTAEELCEDGYAQACYVGVSGYSGDELATVLVKSGLWVERQRLPFGDRYFAPVEAS